MGLGEKISFYRKRKGISQESLAEIMGVSRQSVSLWENNQTIPSMEKLLQLSELLGLSMNEIVGNDLDIDMTELPITKAKTKINLNMIDVTINMILKKMRTFSIVISTILVYLSLASFVEREEYTTVFAGVALFVIAIIWLRYILTRKKLKDTATRDIQVDPDKTFYYDFFNDYVLVQIKSAKTDSKYKLEYKDISKVIETEKYYLLLYNNRYYSVDKNAIQGNVDFLQNILRSRVNTYQSPAEKIDNRASDLPLRKRGTLKTLSTIFFVLTFFTLPLALMVLALYTGTLPNYSIHGSVENLWIFLVVLPLPIASIIIGILMKKNAMKGTKNIIIGAIMGGFLIIYSTFPLVFGSFTSHDYSYVDNLEIRIDFELPDTGQITTADFTNGSSSDGTIPKYDSDVLFTDNTEIIGFENRIKNSSVWTESIATQNIGMLSTMASFIRDNYDNFMIYNEDLDTYNELPNTSGIYSIIFIAYNSEDNTMKIMEYGIEIIVDWQITLMIDAIALVIFVYGNLFVANKQLLDI